jgi:hypothetical protein
MALSGWSAGIGHDSPCSQKQQMLGIQSDRGAYCPPQAKGLIDNPWTHR